METGPNHRASAEQNVRDARQKALLWGIAITGLVVTLLLAYGVLESVRKGHSAEIQSRVTDLVGRVETEFNVETTSLRALQAFVQSAPDAGDEAFVGFADSLHEAGIGAVAYGMAVRRDDVDPGEPGAFQVIRIEPSLGIPELMDENLMASPQVTKALLSSIDRGRIQLSEPLSESVAADTPYLTLAIAPVFSQGIRNTVAEQRRENARAVVFSVLDLQGMIGHVVRTSSYAGMIADGYLGMEVINQRDSGSGMAFFRTANFAQLISRGNDAWLHDVLISEREMKLAQGAVKFRMAFDTRGAGYAPYLASLTILLIGLILTLAALFYAWSRTHYEQRVNALVQTRTRALEKSEQRFHDMAEVSADWFWEMDSDLRFSYLSDRFEQVTGMDRDDFMWKTREEAAGVDDFNTNESWRGHLEDIRANRPFHDFRYHVTRDENVSEYFSISGKPVFDSKGIFKGYRGTGRDVTAEALAQHKLRESETRLQRNVRQLESSRQELEESTAMMAELAERYAVEKDRAEASERSKSEFLASMSHEIRTPMTGVMGFADMLLDSSLAPEDREKVLKIKGATQNLLTIINDILDLSKLDAGRLKIENLDFNMKTAIEEVLDLVRERARLKNLKLKVEFPDDMDVGMHGDPTRFRQILINLVGNAVKFTHDGSVTIKARMIGQEPTATVEFKVIDTGIGISKENSKKLFFDFSQADSSISRHYEGTGLGLSISKRLVELMGGKIWVDSKVGEGSEFCFTLPYRKATTDVTNISRLYNVDSFETKRQLNILIAEDNKLNQRIIVATLDKFGHQSTVVEDGEQAVQQVDKGDYDLILMDVRMPEMSGPDATRIIRARSDRYALIPIIALTADAMEEHIRGYLDAGMNACVTKPIDRAVLAVTINDVMDEEIHIPRKMAVSAKDLQPDGGSGTGASDQQETINVTDFLKELDGVAVEIERNKRSGS